MTQEIVVVLEDSSPDIVVVVDEEPPEVDMEVTVLETGLVGPRGPEGPEGPIGPSGLAGTTIALQGHVDSPLPHPVYDDGPSFLLLYQNAKV